MTLPSATLFPQSLLPLYIFEPRYRQMLSDALQSNRMFSVAMQKPGVIRESPCPVAGLGLIRVSVGHKDGTSHLILQGLSRVELVETVQYKPYRVQRIRLLETEAVDNVVIDALVAKVHELVIERVQVNPIPLPSAMQGSKKKGGVNSLKEVVRYLEKLPGPEEVADLVSCALLSEAAERQAILETVDLEQRLKRLIRFLLADIRRHRKNSNL